MPVLHPSFSPRVAFVPQILKNISFSHLRRVFFAELHHNPILPSFPVGVFCGSERINGRGGSWPALQRRCKSAVVVTPRRPPPNDQRSPPKSKPRPRKRFSSERRVRLSEGYIAVQSRLQDATLHSLTGIFFSYPNLARSTMVSRW